MPRKRNLFKKHKPLFDQELLKSKNFKPLKVGFDLDGVILYNPARIIRRPVVTFKHFFIPKREKIFYVPQTPFERWFWHLLHKSSFMIAPGYKKIHELTEAGLIEPYVITARFGFLRPDFEKWGKKLGFKKYFKGQFMNEDNMQPHEFKERMIKELGLDIFVEDNWNIVEHLNNKLDTDKTKILWIYNIFDKKVQYPLKYPVLKNALREIEKIVHSQLG